MSRPKPCGGALRDGARIRVLGWWSPSAAQVMPALSCTTSCTTRASAPRSEGRRGRPRGRPRGWRSRLRAGGALSSPDPGGIPRLGAAARGLWSKEGGGTRSGRAGRRGRTGRDSAWGSLRGANRRGSADGMTGAGFRRRLSFVQSKFDRTRLASKRIPDNLEKGASSVDEIRVSLNFLKLLVVSPRTGR